VTPNAIQLIRAGQPDCRRRQLSLGNDNYRWLAGGRGPAGSEGWEASAVEFPVKFICSTDPVFLLS